MTEIPEHLLKRSRERRAALGLGGDAPASEAKGEGEAAASVPATSTPTPAAATPVPVEEAKPEPPKPVPAYVQAAQRRRRVPYWAMPVLAGLPLWAYVFASTLSPPPVENDPVDLGGEIYTNSGCSGCHGPSGGGSAAVPGFEDGALLETWPDFRDQMMWVRIGAAGWPGDTYGAQQKAEQSGTMPPQPSLTDQELAQVVLYERQVLSGIDVEAEEPDLLAIANGEMTFEEAGIGPESLNAGIPEDQLAAGG